MGAAGVCIPVKLLLAEKDTLNDCFCYRSRVHTPDFAEMT